MNLPNIKVHGNISSDNYRSFVISTFLYYLCIIIHAGLLILFYFIGVYFMALFNIASISIFIINIFLNYRGKLSLAYNLAITEILTHALLATIFIGWSSNFPVYAVSLLVVNVFCSSESGRKRLFGTFVTTVANTAVYIYCTVNPPLKQLDSVTLAIIGAINLVTICMAIIVVCYIYYKTTEKLKVDFFLSEKLIEEQKKLMEDLKHSQEQLIQSEKMASLGSLVAGVSHEISTPLGVSFTAASHLKDSSKEFNTLYQSGKLKHSDVKAFMKLCEESANILFLNLRKASDLISSFKQIAVDQSVEDKRSFNLREYINEILLSLHPKLKKTKINVHVNCPEEIEIFASPGGISQIITNLVINSLIHAYNPGDEGIISIDISKQDTILDIKYLDDGKGIDKDIIGKIFDPFFTTRRGSGGTGLGLNIVYNIVTQKYSGSIKCESEIEKGTSFMIKLQV